MGEVNRETVKEFIAGCTGRGSPTTNQNLALGVRLEIADCALTTKMRAFGDRTADEFVDWFLGGRMAVTEEDAWRNVMDTFRRLYGA